MNQKSEYQRLIYERYGDLEQDPRRPPIKDEIEYMATRPADLEVEDEMLAFAKENPEATLDDLYRYFMEFLPPLEMVDEIGEDDEENYTGD